MRLTIDIEGGRATGKTRLAQFIEIELVRNYDFVFLGSKRESVPYPREIYHYEVTPK